MKTDVHVIISCRILLRIRNVSDKSCTENQNTHFMFSSYFFENRAVYEIVYKNIVQPDRPQMTIWRMHTACRIPKDTNIHLEYAKHITFPLQQWLRERASMLRFDVPCLS